MTKREKMIESFMKQPDAVKHDANDFVLISYKQNNIFAVAVWQYRSEIKPYLCGFRTAEEAQKHIEYYQTRSKWEADRRAAEAIKAAEDAAKIQAGAILYSSWGYDQTNIDFYKILSRKGKTVTMQRIGSKIIDYNDHCYSGRKIADDTIVNGEVMTKRINKFGTITLNSFSFCGAWDGQPKSFSSYA